MGNRYVQLGVGEIRIPPEDINEHAEEQLASADATGFGARAAELSDVRHYPQWLPDDLINSRSKSASTS